MDVIVVADRVYSCSPDSKATAGDVATAAALACDVAGQRFTLKAAGHVLARTTKVAGLAGPFELIEASDSDPTPAPAAVDLEVAPA